jgi:hypothetical protein
VVFVVLGSSVVVVLEVAVGTVAVTAAVVGRAVVEVVVPGKDRTVVVGEVRTARGVGVTAAAVGVEVGTVAGIVVGVVVVGAVVASLDGTGSVGAVGEAATGADVSVVVLTLPAFFGGSPLVTTKAMAAAAAAAAIPQTHPFL